MDLIGQLGLDTKDIEAALTRVANRLGNSAIAAEGFNQLILASAAAVAIWAKNFIEASERAEQLQKAIQGVARTLAGSEFNTESGLETRLKEVDTLLEKLSAKKPLSDIIIEKVSDFFTGRNRDKEEDEAGTAAINKHKEIETQLAEKISQQTHLIEIQNKEGNKAVELEKLRLEYAEKRGKLSNLFTSEQRKALLLQEEARKKEIEKKYRDQDQRVVSGIADDEARIAIQNKLNDSKNDQIVKDQEAIRKQKEADMWTEAERGTEADRRRKELADDKKWEEAERGTEADRRRKDLDEERERAALIRKDTEDFNQNVKDDNEQFAKDKKHIRDEGEKILYQNKELTKELKNQLKVQELLKKGDVSGAHKEAMEQDFETKIRDARRDKNPEGVRMLEQQREQARQNFDIDQANKTPRQRANERKGRRAAERERSSGLRRLKDLDDRISRGVTGDGDSDIERRRAERASRAGHDKQSLIPAEQKGYTTTDRALLQQIRDSLTNKDG